MPLVLQEVEQARGHRLAADRGEQLDEVGSRPRRSTSRDPRHERVRDQLWLQDEQPAGSPERTLPTGLDRVREHGDLAARLHRAYPRSGAGLHPREAAVLVWFQSSTILVPKRPGGHRVKYLEASSPRVVGHV